MSDITEKKLQYFENNVFFSLKKKKNVKYQEQICDIWYYKKKKKVYISRIKKFSLIISDILTLVLKYDNFILVTLQLSRKILQPYSWYIVTFSSGDQILRPCSLCYGFIPE